MQKRANNQIRFCNDPNQGWEGVDSTAERLIEGAVQAFDLNPTRVHCGSQWCTGTQVASV